ncbi:MAG: STAS domain-containing protein [Hydrococcus sp. C42_A2020_068]|uniref:Anti-sigma factor antagonist n=1 Tax=Hydrococcus rivularis NIES-593 TaxID=1921803 RepID=A0A1U7HBH9_9CYAN|nr:STAS domain-containing protein [Hydrococcus rivularis]MBF2019523.1 STAS domain-containing protein [Hydrococcus sp. C42_A2020_068]OKH20947.1 anti-anti-sigma factor [Hydrococcus rivularis NIES-593]
MKNALVCSSVATFEPSGYITAANVDEFKQALTTAVTSQAYSVFLVDMSRVEFLDSAGLMAIVTAFRLTQSQGKRFSLCSLAPSVRIIFELTQLDRVFEIFENRHAFEKTLDKPVAV